MVDVRFREAVVDCADPPTLANWWAEFTGYAPRTARDDWSTIAKDDQSIEDPGRSVRGARRPRGNEFCLTRGG